MASDFVHTNEIIDLIKTVLEQNLPGNWFREGAEAGETWLRLLEHGDLADYPAAQGVSRDCPAILIRGLGLRPTSPGGVGGVVTTEEQMRVVHVRGFDQCYDDSGGKESNLSRARARYARIISKALFADPHGRLAVVDDQGQHSEGTLSCEDPAGAQIVGSWFRGWDLGEGGLTGTEDVSAIRRLGQPLWAIACDLVVQVRSGGQG